MFLEVTYDNEPWRQSNYKGKGHRGEGYRGVQNRTKKFVAWDGEGVSLDMPIAHMENTPMGEKYGTYLEWPDRPEDNGWYDDYERYPQDYVLLASSEGDRITDGHGLSTVDCLELLLDAKQRDKNTIFVGFGLNYDVNQILKDLPIGRLWRIHNQGSAKYRDYWINWRPGKSLTVSHKDTKRSVILYDTFGFFQTSFLEACKTYFGEDDPDLDIIEKGKAARTTFHWAELDEFIIPYNEMELRMLVRLMGMLRDDLNSVGINPGQWHGPGAVANRVLQKFNVSISREIPKEVGRAGQYAYAGGRFEQFQLGRHTDNVYEYDIRSAYPSAAYELPNLCSGRWEYVDTFQPGAFGVWLIDYRSLHGAEVYPNRPEPLFCRDEHGNISFPQTLRGWYWTPEASLVPDCVQGGWIFHPTNPDERPFSFIGEMFEQRRILKLAGSSSERALKLILNSIYGKLAQTVGGKNGPPRWHQLEYAGYITSATRAKIYQAIELNPGAIIAAETDAVFSTEPLDLTLSPNLGDWEQTVFDGITYLQSGFYYANTREGSAERIKHGEILCKYRGMDRDRETNQPVGLPYRHVLDKLARRGGLYNGTTKGLTSYSTRFVGLGLGLRTSAVWRSWEKKGRSISLNQESGSNKRYHLNTECEQCVEERSFYDCLHPMNIGGYAGQSYARSLPWSPVEWDDATLSDEEYSEMSDVWVELSKDYAIWQ